jgi:hypothetical protein
MSITQKINFFRNSRGLDIAPNALLTDYVCGLHRDPFNLERFRKDNGTSVSLRYGNTAYTFKVCFEAANLEGTKLMVRSISASGHDLSGKERDQGLTFETTPHFMPGCNADGLNLRRMCRDGNGTLPEMYEGSLRLIAGFTNYLHDIGLSLRGGFDPALIMRGIGLGAAYLPVLLEKFLEDPLRVWLKDQEVLASIRRIANNGKASAMQKAKEIIIFPEEYSHITLEDTFMTRLDPLEYTSGYKRSISVTPDSWFTHNHKTIIFGDMDRIALTENNEIEKPFVSITRTPYGEGLPGQCMYQAMVHTREHPTNYPEVELVIKKTKLLENNTVFIHRFSIDGFTTYIEFPIYNRGTVVSCARHVIGVINDTVLLPTDLLEDDSIT